MKPFKEQTELSRSQRKTLPRFASRRGTSRRSASVLVLVASIFALVFIAYGIYPVYMQSIQSQKASQLVSSKFGSDINQVMKPVLEVSVYKSATDHTLLHKYVDKNDLILLPYITFMKDWFIVASGVQTLTATDTGGASRTFNLWNTNPVCSGNYICNTNTGQTGSTVQLGTGVCSVARTDTALCAPFQSAVGSGQAGYSPTTGNVTISASITATSSATISESGVIMSWLDSGGTQRNVLFFHDVFTGLPVTNGNIVVIQYTLELNNTGFTNTFGELLALLFTSVAVSTTETNPYPNVVDNGGHSIALDPEYVSTGIATAFNPVASAWIEVGTGGSTALARSMSILATSTCSTNTIQSPTTLSTSTVILQAGLSCATPQTISEADLMAFTPNASGSQRFMFWRAIFTGVPIGAGATVGVTWNLVFNLVAPAFICHTWSCG